MDLEDGIIRFLNAAAGTAGNTISWSERMRIDTSGNVGIGTTSPNQDAWSSTNTVATVKATGSGARGVLELIGLGNSDNNEVGVINFMSQAETSPLAAINGLRHTSDTSGKLSFDTAGSERMRITETGNVGIGTTIPARALNVVATADSTPALRITRNGDATQYMEIQAGGADTSFISRTASANSQFQFISDVGGTQTTRMKLDSAGTLTVTDDLVAFGSPSDKRLKENIKPIKSALNKVSKLQGVTFNWKESDSILDIKEDVGFIAQDVQKVIPELVRENENGMLSMRHQGIAPILLEAIKELKAEIEELKKQIK